MKKFTYIDLFAGIGGFRKALDSLGGECVFSSEIDKFASKAYAVLHGHNALYGDITEIDEKDIPEHDLLVGGFPCFPAGQKIITETGFKNIEDIAKGDRVLTHKGRYREVVTPMSKKFTGNLYEIMMSYYRIPIETTPEHPFYTERGWVEAKDLRESDYVGFPINKNSAIPEQISYERKINQYRSNQVTSSLPIQDKDFWKLVGYWVAEGWTVDKRKRPQGIRDAYRIVMAANDRKLTYITNILKRLEFSYNIAKEETCYKIHIINKELWLFIKQFTTGSTASEKILPEFVQDLPKSFAKSLIDGYFEGDGSLSDNYKSFSSTSLSLLESLQRLLLKTDKRLYSLALGNKAGETVIEGRKVKTKDCYYLRGGQQQGGNVRFTEDYVFFKVDKITKSTVSELSVFNFEVEEDNSYTLPMIAVHNCQAFSVAGKRLGFDDARGSMFFEIARIAKEKQPRVLLLENVKGLVGHDKGKTLDTMVKILNETGYVVDFEVLNSKFFDVPQNRERIFIVAVREDIVEQEPWSVKGTTVVPRGKRRISGYEDEDAWELKTFNFDYPDNNTVNIRLRDVLEPYVDEKYYLSEEKTEALVSQLNDKDVDDVPSVIHNIYGGFSEKKPRIFKGQSPTIRTSAGGGHLPSIIEHNKENDDEPKANSVGNVNPSGRGMNGQVYDIESGLSPTLTTNKGEGVKMLEEVRPVLTPERVEKRQNGRRFKGDDEEAFTVTTQDRHGVAIGASSRYRIRKLTPLECFRLQSFSDEAHQALVDAGISDSQRYKMAGNAVTVNVVRAIGERLLKYLE